MNQPVKDLQSQIERIFVVPPTMDIPHDVRAFYAQSRDEQLEQIEVLHAMYRPGVDELFTANLVSEWVAVGIPSGEVLAKGPELETAPRSVGELEVLAREAITRCVPFIFVRPTINHPGRG